ncbi:MAG: hypothetical protein GX162_10800 [Firmicutes bacterium]|nr:hypothetical protein [Bacillota bacterium]
MPSEWQAGFSQVDITPWMGVELSGYGFYLGRRTSDVHSRLLAQGAAFRTDDSGVLIISADVLGYDRDSANRVRTALSQATGLPVSAIALCATHTHCGPATFFLRGCGEVSPEYLSFFEHRLIQAGVLAWQRLRPATLYAAHGRLPGVAFNRTRQGGPVDDLQQCLFVCDDSGDLMGILTRFSCHAVVFRNTHTHASPDWVGEMRTCLRSKWPGLAVLFLQGACGDLNPAPLLPSMSYEQWAEGVGHIVAGGVMQLWARRRPLGEGGLSSLSRMVSLPADLGVMTEEQLKDAVQKAEEAYRKNPSVFTQGAHRFWSEYLAQWQRDYYGKGAPDAWSGEIQCLRIGHLSMLFHGAEMFSAVAQEIRDQSFGDDVWVVGYTNDFWGYIPDPVDFERRGYAAVTVPGMTGRPHFVPDIGAVVAHEAAALVREVKS